MADSPLVVETATVFRVAQKRATEDAAPWVVAWLNVCNRSEAETFFVSRSLRDVTLVNGTATLATGDDEPSVSDGGMKALAFHFVRSDIRSVLPKGCLPILLTTSESIGTISGIGSDYRLIASTQSLSEATEFRFRIAYSRTAFRPKPATAEGVSKQFVDWAQGVIETTVKRKEVRNIQIAGKVPLSPSSIYKAFKDLGVDMQRP